MLEELNVLILNEHVSAEQWPQGIFNTNGYTRLATVTDVVQVAPQLAVVAHRAAGKVYLLDLTNFTVLQTLPVVQHPDKLMFFPSQHLVLMTNYTNTITSVIFQQNPLSLIPGPMFTISGCTLHGIQLYPQINHIILGGCTEKAHGPLIIARIENNKTITSVATLKMPRPCRVKDVWCLSKTEMICAIDHRGPNHQQDSWVVRVMLEHGQLREIACLSLPNTQVDGMINNGSVALIAAQHLADGYIIELQIQDCVELRRFKTRGFPHGIILIDGYLLYTSYSDSCVVRARYSVVDQNRIVAQLQGSVLVNGDNTSTK